MRQHLTQAVQHLQTLYEALECQAEAAKTSSSTAVPGTNKSDHDAVLNINAVTIQFNSLVCNSCTFLYNREDLKQTRPVYTFCTKAAV